MIVRPCWKRPQAAPAPPGRPDFFPPGFAQSLLALVLLGVALCGCGSTKSTTTPMVNHSPFRIVLSPGSAEVTLGGQLAFHAVVQDSGGNTLSGVAVHWLSTDTLVAPVDSTGRTSTLALGNAFIEARTTSLKARVQLTVVSGLTTVVRVEVFPPSARLLEGDEQQWMADPRDAAGAFVASGVNWSSDNPAVATVDALGAVRAIGAGSATLSARSGTIFGTALVSVVAGPTVTTVAGSSDAPPGGEDGSALSATFDFPVGIAVDSLGAIYVTDAHANSVRAIENGVVRTLAGGVLGRGYVDSVGPTAQFDLPVGIAVAPGRRLIVADRGDSHIRQVLLDGSVTTLAGFGGPGYADGHISQASFSEPVGVAVGPSGVIYVGDVLNHVIRMISGSVVSTVAGVAGQGGFEDGKPGQLDQPVGLAMGPNQTLYFADRGDQASAIRKLALGSGTLSTVAGNGRPGFFNNDMLHTQFRNPYAVAVAPDGWIYVADPENRRVRAISPTGTSSTVCGNGETGDTDGSAGAARLGLPLGLAFLPSGELLVLDATKRKIRKIQGTLHLSAPIWPQWAVQRLAVRPQWKRITIPSIDPTAPRR